MRGLFKGEASRNGAGNESPLNKQIRKSNLCFLEIQIYSNCFFILLRLRIELISKLSVSPSGEVFNFSPAAAAAAGLCLSRCSGCGGAVGTSSSSPILPDLEQLISSFWGGEGWAAARSRAT